LPADPIGHELGQAAEVVLRKAILNQDIAAFKSPPMISL
jgi:hypothetical protein